MQETSLVLDLKLPEHEEEELLALEDAIRRAALDTAEALLVIHDKKLYRCHGTFAEYCRKRFGMAERTAYNLIHFAKLNHSLSLLPNWAEMPHPVESHARELAGLSPGLQREAWQKAVERVDGNLRLLTARVVREAVKKVKAGSGRSGRQGVTAAQRSEASTGTAADEEPAGDRGQNDQAEAATDDSDAQQADVPEKTAKELLRDAQTLIGAQVRLRDKMRRVLGDAAPVEVSRFCSAISGLLETTGKCEAVLPVQDKPCPYCSHNQPWKLDDACVCRGTALVTKQQFAAAPPEARRTARFVERTGAKK